MRVFMQMVCVLTIAVGAGLLGFSNKLQPHFNPTDPTTLTPVAMSYEDRDQHFTASAAGGVGIGFLLFGTLGLVIPWVNRLGSAMKGELGDNSARTISTITIWLSIAMILTFGVFHMNWPGTIGLGVEMIIVAILCSAATITSAIIFGWKPWMKNAVIVSQSDQQNST
jgi:hypothetical protein